MAGATRFDSGAFFELITILDLITLSCVLLKRLEQIKENAHCASGDDDAMQPIDGRLMAIATSDLSESQTRPATLAMPLHFLPCFHSGNFSTIV